MLLRQLFGAATWLGVAALATATAGILGAPPVSAQGEAPPMRPLHTLNVRSSQDLHQFFRYTGQDIPLISGHRGGMATGYPENCVATFENTLRHTPAFFEIDPRLSKDDVIVLMHDATLDRTTTGSGKVRDHTWAQLQKLRLKDAGGNVTPYSIPTLEEVIEWSQGKTILNLDKKDVPLPMIAALLRKHQAQANVMLTVHDAEQARFYLEDNKERMLSAFVKTPQALAEYEAAGVPWGQVLAYVGPLDQPQNKEMYDLLHARGVMCMISAAPSYDKLPDAGARLAAYQQIIRGGADVIESDLPIEAAAAILPLRPAESPKQKFFGTPAAHAPM